MRLTLGYRGTRYAGWAVQSPSHTAGRPTLQPTVEGALGAALGHSVRVTAAGRTDAGVHADAQVVSFDTASTITPRGLVQVLRTTLPDDVWVRESAETGPDFDARRSARQRWYRYALWRGHLRPSTAWVGRTLEQPDRLDIPAMRAATRSLVGTHDFAAFATRPSEERSTVRTVFAADWRELNQQLLLFEICANAFLQHMVRGAVGSLLWVGAGRWSPEEFTAALASKDRRAAGPNAPASGLTLHRIDY